jgi:hypothetical protein
VNDVYPVCLPVRRQQPAAVADFDTGIREARGERTIRAGDEHLV